MDKKPIIEGLLYIVGDEGISLDELLEVLEITKEELNMTIISLTKDYEEKNRGLTLEFYGNKIKMVTKKEYSNYYQKLYNSNESRTLSPAALETLAIVAYNQPVTRVTIDEIRGVSSSHLVRKLTFLNLIKEAGKSELPGKPNLYVTTDEFLDYFGINSIKDLPEIHVQEKESEDTELFTSKYTEE